MAVAVPDNRDAGPPEFQRLDRTLDAASDNIRVEKHDRQARSPYGNPYWFN